MKKQTLIIGVGLILAFMVYRYYLRAKSPAKSSPSSSIAKEEDVAIEPAIEPKTVSVPVSAPVGVLPPTSMPGTVYATYVDTGQMMPAGVLSDGDTVEVMNRTTNTYFIHKILGRDNYIADSIIVPIDALVF